MDDATWPAVRGRETEIETGEGKLYLATVIDLRSRRLLGYAMNAGNASCAAWPAWTPG
ncbi:hypothetical protein [Streptomyces sp. GS7]|uniref:hypothetical protein n=1 Tax=Streptomyces sp. GS7 TaxID=2692234 RepID=UPI001315D206|nr:hypothetical protein [Streptomyces sp. GS7]QHC23381.1 hypothetical protein GR130_20295 [Streptomyces sp. GS7]